MSYDKEKTDPERMTGAAIIIDQMEGLNNRLFLISERLRGLHMKLGLDKVEQPDQDDKVESKHVREGFFRVVNNRLGDLKDNVYQIEYLLDVVFQEF